MYLRLMMYWWRRSGCSWPCHWKGCAAGCMQALKYIVLSVVLDPEKYLEVLLVSTSVSNMLQRCQPARSWQYHIVQNSLAGQMLSR